MSTRVLYISPTESGFHEAAQWLEEYALELEEKCNTLLSKMLREGETYAKTFLGHVETGNTLNSIMGYREGDHGIIFAGGAAVWIEFGTGTLRNQGDPHPKAGELQMNPWGTYGKGYGDGTKYPNGWYYFDEKQQRWRMTKGIPQKRFMYNTAQLLRQEYKRIAQEVFK